MRRRLGGGGRKEVPLTDEIKPGSKKWSAVVANLRKMPFLTDLGGLELNVLAHELTLCRYTKGEAIVTEGDEADGLYQIYTGTACVELAGKTVKQYETGEFFGELALLSAENTKRNATVIATDKTTQCLRMGVADFQHLQSVMVKDSAAAAEEEEQDTSAADVAAAAQEEAEAGAGGFSHGHKAALRKCSSLRAELAAAQRRLREQAEELNAVRTEAARKHEQLQERMQEMDGELEAAAEVAHKLGEETQQQGHPVLPARANADDEEIQESKLRMWELREENEKLRETLRQTQVELEERRTADCAQEAEVARVRSMIVSAWPTCAQDVRKKLQSPSQRLIVEGVPPS